MLFDDKNVKGKRAFYLKRLSLLFWPFTYRGLLQRICRTIGNTQITYIRSEQQNTRKSTGSASPERRGICRRGLSEIYKVRVALNTVIKSPTSFRPPRPPPIPPLVQNCLSCQLPRTVSPFQLGRLSNASKLRIKRKQLVSSPLHLHPPWPSLVHLALRYLDSFRRAEGGSIPSLMLTGTHSRAVNASFLRDHEIHFPQRAT